MEAKKKIIAESEKLRNLISLYDREIDNPVLSVSLRSELKNFIDFLEEEEEYASSEWDPNNDDEFELDEYKERMKR